MKKGKKKLYLKWIYRIVFYTFLLLPFLILAYIGYELFYKKLWEQMTEKVKSIILFFSISFFCFVSIWIIEWIRLHLFRKKIQNRTIKTKPRKEIILSDEINYIIKEVYKLMRELERSQEKTEKQMLSYQKLIPARLFQLLYQKEMTDITTDKQCKVTAVIMTVNTLDFVELIHIMQTNEIFQKINHILTEIVPIAIESGAIIDKFADAGLSALYVENFEKALYAAIEMGERINQLHQNGENYEHFSVGLAYGSVMAGMVGYENRMSVVTISEYMGFSSFLQKMGKKYGARILAAAVYAELIENFNIKYNYRLLGYFYICSSKHIEKIYDIYDGDEIERRTKKRKTRNLFEKGVHLFTERNFTNARLHFIEVLKADRMDKAAKEYLFLCDKYCLQEENAEVYLEIY